MSEFCMYLNTEWDCTFTVFCVPEFTLLWTAMGALLDRFALPSCGQRINVWGLVAWIEARISQALNKRINCLRTHMTSVCLLSQSRSGSERILEHNC